MAAVNIADNSVPGNFLNSTKSDSDFIDCKDRKKKKKKYKKNSYENGTKMINYRVANVRYCILE